MAMCFLFRARPIRLGLGFTAMIVLSYWSQEALREAITNDRSFFGVIQVKKLEGENLL